MSNTVIWHETKDVIDYKEAVINSVITWEGNIESIQLISSRGNMVFRFYRKNQYCYMFIKSKQAKTLYQLETRLAFQQYLLKSDVPVCKSLESKNGKYIEEINQDEHHFLAHACEEVLGQPMHFNHDDPILYNAWGKALGQLHLASSCFPNSDHLVYPSLNEQIEKLIEGSTQMENPLLKQEANQMLAFLASLPKTQKNYGLIHGDHLITNVISNEQGITFIDLEYSHYSWFVDDVIRPFFSEISHNNFDNWPTKFTAYLKGYQSIYSLSQEETKLFSWFLRCKALRNYLWIEHNWKGKNMPLSIQKWRYLQQKMIRDQWWVTLFLSILKRCF